MHVEKRNPPLSLTKLCWTTLIFVSLAFILSLSCQKTSDRHGIKERDAYKAFIDDHVSAAKINENLRYFTTDPHVASSPRNEALADFILFHWKSFGLEDVHLVRYEVLLSFPEEISVELLSPECVKLSLQEESCEVDPDTLRQDVGIPYNAYSRSGDITAPLVYANSGNPQDYDWLEKKGIGLTGKIALVRYSEPYSYRGFKALTAEKRGLAGLLIYSDPQEDGFARGPVFPDGPWGPLSHIQRGGIPYDFIYPGDPLTPGWASKPGCERVPLEKASTLPKILSAPLSAHDALPLLKNMGGERAPDEWQGSLPTSYCLGGSQAVVRMIVKMENPIRGITNVIGCLRGTDDSDGIVLAGNHRDAWVFGGHDPSSGTAALMELARVFGAAKKAGFQPRRSIYFASWDAEEFTLTGSTEWGEDNRDWLTKDLVAYLNVDSAASGKNFSVQAVPCLLPLITQTLKEVKEPDTQRTVFERWIGEFPPESTLADTSDAGKVEPIGSGTDHTVFLNHIGSPALDMTFSGEYGVYHSMYDDYYWMSHFGDPGMAYSATLVKIWAHMLIELTCNQFLPLDYGSYASELKNYLSDWAQQYDPSQKKSQRLFRQFDSMEKEAIRLNSLIADTSSGREYPRTAAAHSVNRLLVEMERNFTRPEGIPNRPWFKHLVFGTRYTYDVLLFPELTESAEAGDEAGVAQALGNLEYSSEKAIECLKRAIQFLD